MDLDNPFKRNFILEIYLQKILLRYIYVFFLTVDRITPEFIWKKSLRWKWTYKWMGKAISIVRFKQSGQDGFR